MRVLLVYPKSSGKLSTRGTGAAIARAGKKSYAPPLGLLTLAALLPQDWECSLVDLTFQDISPRQWQEVDLVILTGTIFHLTHLLEITRESKKRNKLVAVGGPGIFHFPEEALKAGADFVAKGEGERTLPLLLDAIRDKRTGVFAESPGPADLSNTPVPRFDLLDLDAYVDMSIQFSRGCPFECEFCDATHIFGRKVRTKEPDRVIAEFQRLYDLGWRRQVFVVDDNFIGRPSATKALLEALIPWMEAHGRPFELFTHASVDLARHPDLMELMVKAGFMSVYLGIETPDKAALELIKKRQNVRADLVGDCKKINSTGLELIAGTIIGLDGETPGSDQRLCEFVEAIDLPLVEIDLLHAFPGTALWNRLSKEDRLLVDRDYLAGQSHDLSINFVPLRPIGEVVDEYVSAMRTLYDPSAFLERAFRHYDAMNPLPYRPPSKRPYPFEIKMLVHALVRWGLLWPTRRRFWKHIWHLMRNHGPFRVQRFVRCCISLDHYREVYTETIEFLQRTRGDLEAAVNRKAEDSAKEKRRAAGLSGN